MFSKKILSLLMTCTLAVSAYSINPFTAQKETEAQQLPVLGQTTELNGGTTDLSIANEEKLIEMLKKSGKIVPNATEEEQREVLANFLKGKENTYSSNPSELTKEQRSALAKIKKQVQNNGSKKDNKKFPGTTERNWDGTVKKDKILVLLQDFSDYKEGMIEPGETDMYYKEYTQQHYQDMLFGDNGYITPLGDRVLSMKQFYEQQSGGCYTVDGKVLGWYTAAKDAAYYGEGDDPRAKSFVYEALKNSAKDANVDLNDYDLEDPYDIDGDGDINEPDGIIDHLMVIHAGVGEEAGGGQLGGNAIWSHSSKLSTGPVVIPGTSSQNSLEGPGGRLAAYAYTIMPEDGASGVFCHEFGHDLGLPDEYDTEYTGKGEPVSSWSIMANGSWAGKVPGTEQTGFSPYGKLYFQKTYGGNWMHGSEVNIKDVPKSGLKYVLDQAAIKGKNNDYVKVNLPEKATLVNVPTSGKNEYFSGKGNDLNNWITTEVDLTGKSIAKLTFKTWFDIEQDFDYAYVQVKAGAEDWVTVPGNLTTTTNPNEANLGNGITGTSNGWVTGEFDLTQFAGQKIQLAFNYVTDSGLAMPGFYVDDINVQADGSSILSDDVEGTPKFTMDNFTVSNGYMYTPQYYILEWRNYAGTDIGLAHLNKLNNIMSFNTGLVIWYVDEFFTDNWVGVHPGQGFLGVVDADQTLNMWHYQDNSQPDSIASTQYQLNDSAFSQKKTDKLFLDFTEVYGRTLTDNATEPHNVFDDSKSYINPLIPDAGRILPKCGLKVYVNGEAKDRSQGTIMIKVN